MRFAEFDASGPFLASRGPWGRQPLQSVGCRAETFRAATFTSCLSPSVTVASVGLPQRLKDAPPSSWPAPPDPPPTTRRYIGNPLISFCVLCFVFRAESRRLSVWCLNCT